MAQCINWVKMAQCINWVKNAQFINWVKSAQCINWVKNLNALIGSGLKVILESRLKVILNLWDSTSPIPWCEKRLSRTAQCIFQGLFGDFEKIQKCPKSGSNWLFFVIWDHLTSPTGRVVPHQGPLVWQCLSEGPQPMNRWRFLVPQGPNFWSWGPKMLEKLY